jgi:polysaccharide deacetylase family sporulation protein PdaB
VSLILLSIPYAGGVSASVFFGNVPRLVPIYSVETEKKQVAISFDTAWGADKTEGILDILKQYKVNATFFMVGFWVEDYPELVKKIDEQGIEIGTHSNTHPDFVKLSESQMELELTTSINAIKYITGKDVNLFRAPYGSYNNTMLNLTEKLGLKTIQWDVDTLDWKGLSAGEMSARVIKKVQPGSIVLMHNDGEHTVEALPLIIEGLKNKGYSFVTVGELIYRSGYEIDHSGKQIRIEG